MKFTNNVIILDLEYWTLSTSTLFSFLYILIMNLFQGQNSIESF